MIYWVIDMKTENSKTQFFSLFSFLTNSSLAIAGIVCAIRVSTQTTSFFRQLLFPNLFFADALLTAALLFVCFCGVLVRLSAMISFLFAFLNSFALFQYISADSVFEAKSIFACVLLCVSILDFCFAAQWLHLQSNNSKIITKNVLHVTLFGLVMALPSLLFIFFSFSIIK